MKREPHWIYVMVEVDPKDEHEGFYNFWDGSELEQLRAWAVENGGVRIGLDQFSVRNERGDPKFYNETIEAVEIYREASGVLNVIVEPQWLHFMD